MSDLRYLTYATGGGAEWMMARGPRDGPQLVVVQPLFEEMNRCRAMIAGVVRRLAASGIGCWVPDLPGAGESPRVLDSVAWAEWPAAVADACGHVATATGTTPHLAAIRGGALIDGTADVAARWRLAPAGGAGLLRDLARARDLAGVAEGSLDHAGYAIAPALAEAIGRAEPAPLAARVARLADDPLPGDARIDAAPIWRVSEPVAAGDMAAAIAGDVAGWLTRCAA